ncbi:putative bifunctional diguanylate cyclase/phosphodiesterase [Hylemonella gracilis]|uniref:Periplasmic sensor diguanylate cyclase/phosphodiesterase n=1 Tax=Hylemonella gracilis ATCC 19624 TaxID=887062 RepID=F3KSV2_9BURK|nr:EAL domain-containing protein [Hylemonella gracilis]EGI77171.1 periplasmic sensor diguanylate cyclase/phosphodiesterase [Hylemonella gracilis ATCC 19624]
MKATTLLQHALASTASEPEVLHDWRARILSTILAFVAVLGVLTAAPGIWLAAQQGLWGIAWVDLIALVWVLVLWRSQRLSYLARTWNLLALIYLIGVWFLFYVGPVSQIYLIAFPVMAALLLGLRPALFALAVNAVTLMTIGYLGNTDLHVAGFDERPFVEWVVITVNFLFINAVITLSCAVLLQQLERSLERQRDFALSLKEGQDDLRRVNTELQHTAQALNRLAYYDELTGLPNRRLLIDRLNQAQASARRGTQGGTLLYLDLDRFKNINDARGHAAGDALLVAVAKRLSGLLREEDTVARLGGDEFVILSPHSPMDAQGEARAARVVADKVRESFGQPFMLDGQPYSTHASIGVVVLGGMAQGAEELLRDADTAMYRAKSAGRNRVAYFEAGMQQEVEDKLKLEHDLMHAITQDQLALHLQSQVDAVGAIVGVELLLRWTHPTLGAIPPSRFIPIAEESNLILNLGDWVLEQGCRIQRQLREAGHPVPVSINVSPQQFHQPDFVEHALALLDRQHADPTQLIFEVTEGLLLDDLEQTIERMEALAERGIRFSIDDFGTGYSSLAYLKRLPLHELKIDRSFITDTPHDPGDTAIVEMILSMARHLELKVVAEGVETRAQSDFLSSHGCTAQQGYLHAKPQPLDRWLAHGGRLGPT